MYFINDRYTAIDGQVEFKLSKPYIDESLKVSINGIDTKGFIQKDKFTVELLDGCVEGDLVQIYTTYNSNNIAVRVISNSPAATNSIFNKYGDTEKIKHNHKFIFNLVADGENSTRSFVSKLAPYYTSISKIRLDTGELLEEVSDEKILTMIYLNSKECDDVTEELDDVSDKLKKAWVRWKTDMDLVYAIYLTMSGQRGSMTKKLGATVEIKKDINIPRLKDMLSRFKDKFDKVDESINNTTTAVANMMKAGNSSYPVNVARLF